MAIHLGGEGGDFVSEQRQGHSVAFGELANAASEGLGDAVEFALDGGGEGGEPLVIHDEGLDFVLGELGVFRQGELVEGFLGLAEGALEFGFLGSELEPLLKDGGFVFGVLVGFDFLETGIDLGLGDFIQNTEEAFLAAVFLLQLGDGS